MLPRRGVGRLRGGVWADKTSLPCHQWIWSNVVKAKGSDLRELCVQEALAIIETEGVENLSLREIARRLGVSHQAPYKHFPSRDHVLAEIVSRAFAAFADYLDEHLHTGSAEQSMEAMGRAYMDYAVSHPLQYRLMFATPLPDPEQHPHMMQNARHAFSLLHQGIIAMRQARGESVDEDAATLDALFIWSTLHGLAGILKNHALATLKLSPALLEDAVNHTLERIGAAMNPKSP